MSSTMRWEPVQPVRGHRLSSDFKLLISTRWFGHDGSLAQGEIVLSTSDIPFLEGIIWGSNNTTIREDARTLVDRINDHDYVRVWIE